jgi:hypothetical protein
MAKFLGRNGYRIASLGIYIAWGSYIYPKR